MAIIRHRQTKMDKAGPANRELCLTRSFLCEKKMQPPLSLQDLTVLLAGNGAKALEP